MKYNKDQLESLLRYNPDTGQFFWRVRDEALFTNSQQALAWNNKFSGKEAFTSLDGKGYKHGDIFNKRVYPHQLAIIIIHGEYDSDKYAVDHIDGNRCNNKIKNLRLVEYKDNSLNMKKPVNNTSGYIGVTWHKGANKWMAQVHSRGKCYYLGLFESVQEAVDARLEKQKELGFHDNHGR